VAAIDRLLADKLTDNQMTCREIWSYICGYQISLVQSIAFLTVIVMI